MEEQWRDIPGFEGYFKISTLGRVLSLPRTVRTKYGFRTVSEKFISVSENRHGGLRVTIKNSERSFSGKVADLVLLTFDKERPDSFHISQYKDENPLNVSIENLFWAKSSLKLESKDVLLMRRWVRRHGLNYPTAEWCTRFGVDRHTIFNAVHGRSFKDLPFAVTEEKRLVGGKTNLKIPRDHIQVMYQRRHNRPEEWTWQRLADQCNTLYGTHYGPTNVKRLVEGYAESKNLALNKNAYIPQQPVQKIRVPRAVKAVKVVKLKPYVQKKNSVMSQERIKMLSQKLLMMRRA